HLLGKSRRQQQKAQQQSQCRSPVVNLDEEAQRQQLLDLGKTDLRTCTFIDENSLACAASRRFDMDSLACAAFHSVLKQRYVYDRLMHDGIYASSRQQEYYFDRRSRYIHNCTLVLSIRLAVKRLKEALIGDASSVAGRYWIIRLVKFSAAAVYAVLLSITVLY
uniref:Glycosyltransferase family 2 protein n=1 Tax=Macrostomum lignano TaxID=282301 RepID=A0A1I8FB46_9PLAT